MSSLSFTITPTLPVASFGPWTAIFFCSFFLPILATSCRNPEAKLELAIKQSLNNDKHVSEQEFKAIQTLSSSDNILKDRFPTSESLYKKIDDVALKLSKRGRDPLPYPPEVWIVDSSGEEPKSAVFNVYLENSGSMDGYMNGRTEFKDALFDILTNMRVKKQDIQFFFIN